MMKRTLAIIILLMSFLCQALAQQSGASSTPPSIKLTLKDAGSGEPVSFATVSLTRKGQTSVYKYSLSGENGSVSFEKVPKGSYTIKAELMGYTSWSKEISVPSDRTLDLGSVEMSTDAQQLESAKVTATSNAMEFNRDTVTYNASSFVMSDNAVLADLLKKLPGVEVSDDGSITVNGESVKKVTIDGKTFFLDDPTVASKNILAKYIKKIKVVEKKTDMAEFTGVDDGERETVIDLTVHDSMLNGIFGNVNAGLGHDIPSNSSAYSDYRYLGSAFAGKFTKKAQVSLILNANNTNTRVSANQAGNMLRSMRGNMGSTGDGITKTYMAGVNGALTLDERNSELGANYIFNQSDNTTSEEVSRESYLSDRTLLYESSSQSGTIARGHGIGARLNWKISDATQILFEPSLNFGSGSFTESSSYKTDTDYDTYRTSTNEGNTFKSGDNHSVSTSGNFIFKQRLGIPGRVVTVNANYSFSNNTIDGINKSDLRTWETSDPTVYRDSILNQTYDQGSRSANLYGKVSYTEPLGAGFYLEGNYSYRWSNSTSEKNTYSDGIFDPMYSNSLENTQITQRAGLNAQYQSSKFRAQIGVSVDPTTTKNKTVRSSKVGEFERSAVNWAPLVSLSYDPKRGTSFRFNYSGQSAQPSSSQLMPVLDLTNQTNLAFGNPYLSPYFTHSARINIRYTNQQTHSSYNMQVRGTLTQSPIVSAIWYGDDGVQYSMPFNGKDSKSVNANGTFNIPIGSTGLSVRNNLSGSWSERTSYVGTGIKTSDYYSDGEFDYAKFHEDYADIDSADGFEANVTSTLTFNESLRLSLKIQNVELSLQGSTRMNRSWYTISTKNTQTWSNGVNSRIDWNWQAAGISLNSEINYRWYNGYTTALEPECIWNAEISKSILKNLTLSVSGKDLLAQEKTLNVSDSSNQHRETITNTLGRYVIVSVAYNFGQNNRRRGNNWNGGNRW